MSADKELLEYVLNTFPLIPLSRTVIGENDNTVVEWQFDGKYFEIEANGNGELEIMVAVDNEPSHWILKPVSFVKR